MSLPYTLSDHFVECSPSLPLLSLTKWTSHLLLAIHVHSTDVSCLHLLAKAKERSSSQTPSSAVDLAFGRVSQNLRTVYPDPGL
jgi:hypothetical protein